MHSDCNIETSMNIKFILVLMFMHVLALLCMCVYICVCAHECMCTCVYACVCGSVGLIWILQHKAEYFGTFEEFHFPLPDMPCSVLSVSVIQCYVFQVIINLKFIHCYRTKLHFCLYH
jgi:hypothetical protein